MTGVPRSYGHGVDNQVDVRNIAQVSSSTQSHPEHRSFPRFCVYVCAEQHQKTCIQVGGDKHAKGSEAPHGYLDIPSKTHFLNQQMLVQANVEIAR